jgi:sugar/nucleoside kinase (ribokinase family)
MASVLAVGTVAFDSIETPFGRVEQVLGGSATYIGRAARYFSAPIRLSAVVGADFPEAYLERLRSSGMDLAGLRIDPEGETFAWGGRYHYDLNTRDTLYTHLNVLETFDADLPPQYSDSRIVCLGNLDPGIQRRVLAQVDRPELVVLDTMNFWIEHTPDSLLETLKLVDCLIINDAEARELSNEPNLVKAARLIRTMGPRILIIKKGEHGALLFSENTVFSAPAYPLEEIIDPTGAGDTFMGGFVGYLAREEDYSPDCLKRAVIYGSAMASFAVERFGPDRLFELGGGEIDARVMAFRDLSAIPQRTQVS